MRFLFKVTFPEKIRGQWVGRDENVKVTASSQEQAEEVLLQHLGDEDYTYDAMEISYEIWLMLACASFSYKTQDTVKRKP